MGAVIRMTEHASVACSDPMDMQSWAQSWVDGIFSGGHGKPRSIVIVMEDETGEVGCVTQSLRAMDTHRLVGLLTTLAHRKIGGKGNIEEMG